MASNLRYLVMMGFQSLQTCHPQEENTEVGLEVSLEEAQEGIVGN